MAFRMIRIPLIKNNKDVQIFNTWLLKQMRITAIMFNIPLIRYKYTKININVKTVLML